MARGLLASVFAVVMCLLTVLPGSGADDPTTAGAPAEPGTPPVTDRSPDPSPDPSVDPTTADPTTAPAAPTSAPSAPTAGCPVDPTPATPLVDAEATPEAVCLAARLDNWRSEGRYGLGQQLNVSSSDYLAPLEELLPARPAVVGFDLDELDLGETYGFDQPPLDALLELAGEGVVLTASWHTPNPATGGDAYDRGWQDLGALLARDGSDRTAQAAYDAFWADVDAKLALLLRLQTGDGGRYAPAAVVFRPFHEANGDWFWWAQGADPSAYKQLYAAVQARAAAAGVHDVVWGWSANARNDARITDPLTLLPDRVDLAGVDSYEPMADAERQGDRLDLSGLADIAGRVPRAAVTEAGPHGSRDGAWDPGRIAPSATALGVSPVYVMLWFDDGDGLDGYTGSKQLGSLRGGTALLAGCDDGVCPLG